MDDLHSDTENSFRVCSNWSVDGLGKILCKLEHIELGLYIFRIGFFCTLNDSKEVNSPNNLIDVNPNFLNVRIGVNIFIYFHLFFS